MSFVSRSLARTAPLLSLFAVLATGSAHAQTYPALSETLLDVGADGVAFDAVADLNHDGIDDIVAMTYRNSQFTPSDVTTAIAVPPPRTTLSSPVPQWQLLSVNYSVTFIVSVG